jgi:hypothetical protein
MKLNAPRGQTSRHRAQFRHWPSLMNPLAPISSKRITSGSGQTGTQSPQRSQRPESKPILRIEKRPTSE